MSSTVAENTQPFKYYVFRDKDNIVKVKNLNNNAIDLTTLNDTSGIAYAVANDTSGEGVWIAGNFSGGARFVGTLMLPELGTDTRYFVWVSGTTYRALRTADGLVEFSGTSAETVITSAIEAMSSGNTNKFSRGLGGVVKLGQGTYDMNVSGVIIRWDNVTLEGAGNFATHLRVSGHRPAIELQGWSGNPDLRNIRIKDLYMTAEISGYSGSLLSLTGQSGTVAAGVRECEFNNLRFFDNDFRAGNAIGIDHTYGPMVYLTFENIKTDGFNNAFSFVATSGALASASQNWATSNTFRNCRLSQPYVGFNFNGISGSQFYASSFEDCYIQYNAAAQSGSPAPHSGTWTSWNMDDNGLHQNMNITNSIAWDGNATSGQSFAQVNIKSYLTLVGNQSDNVISGAGVVGAFAGGFISGGARILQFGRQSSTYGTADFVAASGQSTFVINHSMTKPPRFAAITPASSGMAASGVRWYTTVDSSNLNVVFASGFASGSNVTMMYRIDL